MASRNGANRRHAHKQKKSRECGGVYRKAVAIMDCPVCGKKCYDSRRAAKEAAKAIFQGQKVRFYTCKADTYWHITTQSTQAWTAWREYDHENR